MVFEANKESTESADSVLKEGFGFLPKSPCEQITYHLEKTQDEHKASPFLAGSKTTYRRVKTGYYYTITGSFLPVPNKQYEASGSTPKRLTVVGEVGFEPTQAEADDFTDRSF